MGAQAETNSFEHVPPRLSSAAHSCTATRLSGLSMWWKWMNSVATAGKPSHAEGAMAGTSFLRREALAERAWAAPPTLPAMLAVSPLPAVQAAFAVGASDRTVSHGARLGGCAHAWLPVPDGAVAWVPVQGGAVSGAVLGAVPGKRGGALPTP